MSIELRIVGEYDHVECDWGRIEYSDPRPDRGEVGHLMLAPGWFVGGLLSAGEPHYDHRYGHVSATRDDKRIFVHMDHQGHRWTWQMFAAHFADGLGPDGLLLGRWPD